MGKREIITGGVVVAAMAIGFGGMVATRLRSNANQSANAADAQGAKDALAAFREEKSAGFPANSSLMEFRNSAPSATVDANSGVAAGPAPGDAQPQPAPPAEERRERYQRKEERKEERYANGGDRYAPAAATLGTDITPQPPADAAAAPVAALAGDPFSRQPSSSAPIAPQADPALTPADPNATPQPPAADPSTSPGMVPLQPLPVVTAGSAPPVQPDQRYNNDYRRREERDQTVDTAAPSPPAASTDAQAQYQYVSPAMPQNSGGQTPGARRQYDAFGREINRDPDPTNSDDNTQSAPSQTPGYGQTPTYGQTPAYGQAPTYGQTPAYGQVPAYGQPPPSDQSQPYGQAPVDNTPPPVRREFPREGGPETYVLQPNDNYWTISQKVYGTGAYFKAIEEHNRERYPYSDKLRAGDVVSVPPVKVLETKYPDLCPKPRQAAGGQSATLPVSMRGQLGGRIYKVQQGDTLFDIARDELGKASRWAELYELNRDVIGDDVDHLSPGMELRLPGDRDPADDPLTTQSRQPYNR